MIIDIPTFIDKLQEPWCETCAGDGYFITTNYGACYDPHQEAWYPEEDYDPCDDCAGTGNVINNHTRTGRIFTHLSKLTADELHDLQNLYEPDVIAIRDSSYQALWVFLENLELETEPYEPAAEELLRLLTICQLIPIPAGNRQPATSS